MKVILLMPAIVIIVAILIVSIATCFILYLFVLPFHFMYKVDVDSTTERSPLI